MAIVFSARCNLRVDVVMILKNISFLKCKIFQQSNIIDLYFVNKWFEDNYYIINDEIWNISNNVQSIKLFLFIRGSFHASLRALTWEVMVVIPLELSSNGSYVFIANCLHWLRSSKYQCSPFIKRIQIHFLLYWLALLLKDSS